MNYSLLSQRIAAETQTGNCSGPALLQKAVVLVYGGVILQCLGISDESAVNRREFTVSDSAAVRTGHSVLMHYIILLNKPYLSGEATSGCTEHLLLTQSATPKSTSPEILTANNSKLILIHIVHS